MGPTEADYGNNVSGATPFSPFSPFLLSLSPLPPRPRSSHARVRHFSLIALLLSAPLSCHPLDHHVYPLPQPSYATFHFKPRIPRFRVVSSFRPVQTTRDSSIGVQCLPFPLTVPPRVSRILDFPFRSIFPLPLVSFLFLPKSLTSCRAISISKPPIHRSLPDADIFRRVDRYVATPLRLSLSLFLGTEPAPEGSTVASKIDVKTPARVVVFRLCSLFPPLSILSLGC